MSYNLGTSTSGEGSMSSHSYRATDSETPSEAIVNAVAALRDCDPLELDPLFTAVDTDAIDNIFGNPSPNGANPRVSFEYEELIVCVERHQRLTITVIDKSD